MKYLSSREIREMWLGFFKSKGHHIEPGASLVPHDDPTLLWINSGVAALKKYFDGSERAQYNRITNAQKSIRTNDIENVGKTAIHHTFFEMLGNFSIGDYFRKEAITWGYELLTSPKYFSIPLEVLYITYHPSDLETKNLWISLGVLEDHLVPLEGNYWEIGEGPSGPNTEIFVDRGEKYDPQKLGIKLLEDELDNDRYVEIWNIVFSQYNAEKGVARENYRELPRKNIDTGSGLERLASVFQETETNFETDLFYPYIETIAKDAKYPYEGEYKLAYRVIADHLRTCTFALSDGANFSNEGRGYVLRRLLRRAVRYLRKLGIDKPYLYTLVPMVTKVMECFYPYLNDHQEKVMRMIKNEEEKFASTLNNGENMLKKVLQNSDKTISGEEAFKLYDTYGFPVELTEETALENGKTVDLKRFEELMEEQKERARSSRGDQESMSKQSEDLINCLVPSTFEYTLEDVKGTVVAIFKNGQKVDSLSDEGEIIFDHTNFYALSGGQIADIGEIINEQTSLKVNNVLKTINKQNLHFVTIDYGTVKVGDRFTLKIDQERRRKIMKNHSATHLLQKALQTQLGEHVHQEGSFVSDTCLRFDFSHFEKLTYDELAQIEFAVNQMIAEDHPGKTEILPIEEAKKQGAMALFSEKYDEQVRVVTFESVSKELCGGTHVSSTGQIGNFALVYEESIAAGIRRIEARTGLEAYKLFKQKEDLLHRLAVDLKAGSYLEISSRVNGLNNELIENKKNNQKLTQELSNLEAKELKNHFTTVGSVHFLSLILKDYSETMLNNLFDTLKVTYDDSVIVLVNATETKNRLIVGVSKKLTPSISAGKIVKAIALITKGNGGGRDEFAQGSIVDLGKFNEAIEEIKMGIK